MQDKTKNIIIIVLSVLLFVSVIFNVINFRPMMRNNVMMQRDFHNHMNNMPRHNQMPDEKQDSNQNTDNNQNDADQKIQ